MTTTITAITMIPRITSTRPCRYATTGVYALHSATVTARGCSADQVAALAAFVAQVEPWATETAPGVWTIRQPRSEGPRPYPMAGGADHDEVDGRREALADELRAALAKMT